MTLAFLVRKKERKWNSEWIGDNEDDRCESENFVKEREDIKSTIQSISARHRLLNSPVCGASTAGTTKYVQILLNITFAVIQWKWIE